MHTRINSEEEKKYMTNSTGFFKEYEPIRVFTPIIRNNKQRTNIAIFLSRIHAFIFIIIVMCYLPLSVAFN